ncbi:unnamed protein product [Paramecium primaurelia]|uniref:Uncharacterized protein n=1 Tax=Paramecium primaurelia TaxID=5886 RepID=A0A8S1JVN6_PARPR|nr:unnamed protein product [Paramecium primaurelia]
MKIFYILSFIVTLCKAQINMAFCDDYIEYDVNYFGKFISNAKLSNNTDAILAEKRVLIIDDNLNVLSSLPIPKTQTHNCEWIFKQSSDTFFVGCQKNGESPYLIAYKNINQTHYQQFGDIVYFPNLNETVIKVTGILNTLFTIQSKKVTLFTLVISVADWSIKTTQNVLDKNYFARTAEINITDITLAPYISDNLQQYKLIVVEYSLGAFWVDTVVKNNILSPFRNGLIDLKKYFASTRYYSSAVIHSTTYNVSQIVFTLFYNGNYDLSIKAVYVSTSTTNVMDNYLFSSNGWSSWNKPILFGNLQGILRRNTLKQSIFNVYNIQIPVANAQYESNLTATVYDPVDTFTSPPQDFAIYYFNTGYRVVHSIENNKLQSCDLYNYKLQME